MKKTKPLTKNDLNWVPIRFSASMQFCKGKWICDSSFWVSSPKTDACYRSATAWTFEKMPAFDAAQEIAAIVITHLRKEGLRAFLNKMG